MAKVPKISVHLSENECEQTEQVVWHVEGTCVAMSEKSTMLFRLENSYEVKPSRNNKSTENILQFFTLFPACFSFCCFKLQFVLIPLYCNK